MNRTVLLLAIPAAMCAACIGTGVATRSKTASPAEVSNTGWRSANKLIASQMQVERDHLVRMEATGMPEKSALLWRVYPAEHVDRATTTKGRLEFVAPPGDYKVELLVITVTPDGIPEVAEFFHTVTVTGGTPPPPPPPPAKPDPLPAISRIQFGNAGCTACPIGPRRADGRWDIFTAAHCVTGVGQKGTMILKDGSRVPVTVSARDARSDVCWLVTDAADIVTMPHAELADALPARGSKVWHQGYGIDKPGNREEGTVLGETSDGQLAFELSVSSGDSGGPIVLDEAGKVVASVCCTTGLAVRTTMYGGHCLSARSIRPKSGTAVEWKPIDLPVVPRKPVADWFPLPMPVKPNK